MIYLFVGFLFRLAYSDFSYLFYTYICSSSSFLLDLVESHCGNDYIGLGGIVKVQAVPWPECILEHFYLQQVVIKQLILHYLLIKVVGPFFFS